MTELRFKGKEFVYNHHLAVPFRPLVMHPEKGIGEPSLDGNLIIQGDNLHALKALLPHYAGKVDCIFIDPPYNIGNEGWRYNDNVNAPMIREWLAAGPIGVEDPLRHDKWCAMMWPRLRLLHELLAEGGTIFVSNNDVENSRLLEILRDIFGDENFIGQFVWKSRQNKDNRNTSGLSNDHEYISVFGKRISGDIRLETNFTNPDGDNRGPWASGNMVGLASKEARPNLHFDLINQETGINYGCPKRGWRYGPERMLQLANERKIIWPAEPSGRPREKVFFEEMSNRTNVSSVIDLPIFTRHGTKALEEIMGDRQFDFPKPPEIVEFAIGQHPNIDAIVLDSFAGSGTTAQAVLELNKRDGGNRRFILVEMEDYADELTAERVRRVIEGYAFSGEHQTELMREKITWTKLKKFEKILSEVEGIERRNAKRYDRVTKTVKNGELIVTGRTAVAESAEGLGGTFSYCTLGLPLELDKLLNGENLPSFEALGAALFHMATNRTFEPTALREGDFYVGEAGGRHIWLIYRPDCEWLKSDEAALTLTRARDFVAAKPEGEHLVFAAARFADRAILDEENLPVEFAPLPFALYRVDRS